MQNQLIELHDSIIEHASILSDSLVLTLSANVHRSHGQPGLHPGTVWRQRAILTFFRVENPSVREFPATIGDGTLGVGMVTFHNLVPTEGSFTEGIHFSVTLDDGKTYELKSEGLRLELEGAPEFIENFPEP